MTPTYGSMRETATTGARASGLPATTASAGAAAATITEAPAAGT